MSGVKKDKNIISSLGEEEEMNFTVLWLGGSNSFHKY